MEKEKEMTIRLIPESDSTPLFSIVWASSRLFCCRTFFIASACDTGCWGFYKDYKNVMKDKEEEEGVAVVVAAAEEEEEE